MKKIVFILFAVFAFNVFPQGNPPIGGELRIFFIDLPSTWDITVDIEALGTVWDEDHYITTDYDGGQEQYSEPDGFHASDFSWDDQGYEPVLSLGHYKITVTSSELGAYIEFDMRTSDLPQEPGSGTIDVEFDYSYNSNEIRHRGESEDITGEDIKIWDLKSFVDRITTNLEPYVPVNLSSTSQNNRPKLIWERHAPPDDYIIIYDIYRSIDFPHFGTLYIGSTTNLYYIDYDVSVGSGYVAYYTVKAVNGNKSASSTIGVDISGFVKRNSGDNNGIINFNKLHQNYPNPFNPNTIINYSVKNNGFVKLSVYDILGKEVALLVNENLSAGEYQVEFDGSNLESGVYFYEITAGDFRDVKKLLLLK